MPGRLQRKVATVHAVEDLQRVQSILEAERIRSTFQIRSYQEHDCFWIFVEIMQAPAARQILANAQERKAS